MLATSNIGMPLAAAFVAVPQQISRRHERYCVLPYGEHCYVELCKSNTGICMEIRNPLEIGTTGGPKNAGKSLDDEPTPQGLGLPERAGLNCACLWLHLLESQKHLKTKSSRNMVEDWPFGIVPKDPMRRRARSPGNFACIVNSDRQQFLQNLCYERLALGGCVVLARTIYKCPRRHCKSAKASYISAYIYIQGSIASSPNAEVPQLQFDLLYITPYESNLTHGPDLDWGHVCMCTCRSSRGESHVG